MAKVLLECAMFGPDGNHYDVGVREVPDNYVENKGQKLKKGQHYLPKTATIMDEDTPVTGSQPTGDYGEKALREIAALTVGETRKLQDELAAQKDANKKLEERLIALEDK